MYHRQEAFRKFGDEVNSLLQRIPEEWSERNEGYIWECLDNYGPRLVGEIIDKEQLLVGVGRFSLLHDYCILWEDMKKLSEAERVKREYKFKFFGDVQDVGFRATAGSYMQILGLQGTAENMYDWTVEVTVQGSESRIMVLKNALSKRFNVTKVEESKLEIKKKHILF